MTLEQALIWVASGGGAGIIAFLIIERWAWGLSLDPKPRQLLAWAISGACGLAALGGGLALGYQAMPATGEAWASVLWLAISTAIGGAKLVHTFAVLGKFTRDPYGSRIEKPPPYNLHH